ncbi:MAG: hypothetical protein AAFU60_14360, partial [Bacteroidota bacterium]
GGSVFELSGTGCVDISDNFIEVIREVADGGTIALENGGNSASICVDGNPDPLTVVGQTTAPNLTYDYVITDDQNTILAITSNPTIDLDGAGPGVCRIWGWSYRGLNAQDFIQRPLSDLQAEDCSDISDNFVEVIRLEGADCDGINPVAINGFTLVNAMSNQDIQMINDGDQIALDELGTSLLNIRASALSGEIKSVALELRGNILIERVENASPYAVFGDNAGNFNGFALQPGNYRLSATPYTAANAGGIAGEAFSINFEIVATLNAMPRVTQLLLVNADTEETIGEIQEGSTFDRALIGDSQLAVVALTNFTPVGSVQFDLQGPINESRLENLVPYALFGDGNNGQDFFGMDFPNGEYAISATAFSQSQGNGSNNTLALNFSITDSRNQANPLKFYPNPSNGPITLELESPAGGMVEIQVVDPLQNSVLQHQEKLA